MVINANSEIKFSLPTYILNKLKNGAMSSFSTSRSSKFQEFIILGDKCESLFMYVI